MVHRCNERIRWALISLALFSLSSMSGCSHSLSKKMSVEATRACQSNALLQKYHCSLKAVATAANNNDADAEYALGYMYYYGIDTVENTEAAKLWMRRAATQGQPQAIQALQILQIPAVDESQITPKPLAAKPTNSKAIAITKTSKHTHSATTAQKQTVTQTTAAKTSSAKLEGSYSIQLAASVDLPRLKEYVLTNRLKGKAGYYRACIKGTAWYILIYGHYPNRTEALQALRELPGRLKKQAPWIKSYKTIQAQVADGNKC